MIMHKPTILLGIILAIVLVCLAAVAAIHFTEAPPDGDTAYEVSTINALMEGVYDGIEPVGGITEHGDFGIGTFDGLDGEMILIDGVTYHARSDGRIYRAADSAMVPWATVTFFSDDFNRTTRVPVNSTSFSSAVPAMVPSQNMIYAVRMHGTFPVMKVRAIPPQQKPYVNLTEASKSQSVFSLNGTTGTVIGFYMPAFYNGINVPGYHLHFISDDREKGGHILDFTIPAGTTVEYDITPGYTMGLPTSGDFTGVDLTKDLSRELEIVEK